MKIFKTQLSLDQHLADVRSADRKVVLIPTMGALHQGHLSLIEQAQQQQPLALLVCSIFVNPTQFNDPADLEKYPRPIEHDIALLEQAGCDILFLPSVSEMYSLQEDAWHLDLGELDTIWEGEKRPGHFQGVTQIVYKLFSLVRPDYACFGQKDFQQVMVIQRMITIMALPITLIICPILRSPQGLALSSRNARLSQEGLTKALVLSKALFFVEQHALNTPLAELKNQALAIIHHEKDVQVEYFAICHSASLKEVEHLDQGHSYVALLTAWVEDVRLIDNILLS